MFYTLNVFYPHIHRLSPCLGTNLPLDKSILEVGKTFCELSNDRGQPVSWETSPTPDEDTQTDSRLFLMKQIRPSKQKRPKGVILCGLG